MTQSKKIAVDSKKFKKLHKEKTGYSLGSEQLVGEVIENKTKAELLAECKAHDLKYYSK